MQLIDDHYYRLPDGTLLWARVPLIGSPRLEWMDGTPIYLYDAALTAWRRLVWDGEGYTAVACDLTDDDLEAMF